MKALSLRGLTTNNMDKIVKMQAEIGGRVKTEENPYFKSKYMDINGLLEQLLPLLEKHKICVIQPLDINEGKQVLETLVIDLEDDKSQAICKSIMILPELQDPQKMGSAITYYRRYALQSLFLLRAEDDDGNNAVKPTKKETPKMSTTDAFSNAKTAL